MDAVGSFRSGPGKISRRIARMTKWFSGSKGMITRPAVLLLVVTTAGCESDARKYERLTAELQQAEVPLQVADKAAAEGKPQCPELQHLPTNAYLDACTDSLSKSRTRVALLRRDMNKFMNR